MDRPIVYAGSVPLDTDVLRLGRYAKAGIGRLAQVVLGERTITASGFRCSPFEEGLGVTISPGLIVAPYALDGARIGTVGAGLEAAGENMPCIFHHDQDIVLSLPFTGAALTLFAICRESDDLNEVLPFYNVDRPEQTMAGPDNRGKLLPTRRAAQIEFMFSTSLPDIEGAVVVPLYRLTVPSGVSNLQGINIEPESVFRSPMSQFATMEFVQQLAQSMMICVSSRVLTAPSWAKRVELRAIGGGGGGGSSNALSPDRGAFSGSGGGAGGDAWGIYPIDINHNASLSVTVGLGGASDKNGGATFVTYDGQPLLSAEGGAAGLLASSQKSTGGAGGAAAGGTLWSLVGGSGSDGQFGEIVWSGDGAEGPWGGGGRSGAFQGMNATRYGAGGGGAYSTRVAGQSASGGRGFEGCVLYRFLY